MNSTDRARGALAGGTCGVLAITAHGFEGRLPDSSALALVLLVSSLIGAGVGSSAGRGRMRLFALLAVGQFLSHHVMDMATGPTDANSAMMENASRTGWEMLAGHAIATLLCALLITAAERLYGTVSQVVRTLLTRFDPYPPIDEPVLRAPHAGHPQGAGLLRDAISRRGPPLPRAVTTAF